MFLRAPIASCGLLIAGAALGAAACSGSGSGGASPEGDAATDAGAIADEAGGPGAGADGAGGARDGAGGAGDGAGGARDGAGSGDGAAVDGGAGNFPARFAAPYVGIWNDIDLAAVATATGHKFYTLAFVVNGTGTCDPKWDGTMALDGTKYSQYVPALRAVGGDVIASFGGASGTELARSCTTVESLRAAYQKVIDPFHLTWVDFDVEGGAEADAPSVDLRNKAIAALQSANPSLRVSYTLAVDRTGLPAAQLALLKSALTNGARVDVVNVMAMDYGPCYTDMGQAAVDAANATRAQLTTLGLGASVGVTPMIGKNDVACETFSVADAHTLVAFASASAFVRSLGYWELGNDANHDYLTVFHGF
jgi:chitinase